MLMKVKRGKAKYKIVPTATRTMKTHHLNWTNDHANSVRVMMALAGHQNMSTTQRYIDLRPGVLRNAVELI